MQVAYRAEQFWAVSVLFFVVIEKIVNALLDIAVKMFLIFLKIYEQILNLLYISLYILC
jgi:hypothetical protein